MGNGKLKSIVSSTVICYRDYHRPLDFNTLDISQVFVGVFLFVVFFFTILVF